MFGASSDPKNTAPNEVTKRYDDFSKRLDDHRKARVEQAKNYVKQLRANHLLDKKKEPFTLVESIDYNRNSVVKIEIIYVLKNVNGEGNRVSVGHGTGFFINDNGNVVTNYHVIQPFIDATPANIPNLIGKLLKVSLGSSGRGASNNFVSGAFQAYEYQIMDFLPDKDLALLAPTANYSPFNTLPTVGLGDKFFGIPLTPKFTIADIEDGARIAVSGYPLAATTLISSSGYIASAYPANGRYEADMRMNPGNSGGPVYLVETGEVIGVAVSIGLAPAELRGANGAQINPSAADSLLILFKQKGQTTPIPIKAINYYFNSGLSQVIAISEVIALAKKNKVVLKYGPSDKPKQAAKSVSKSKVRH